MDDRIDYIDMGALNRGEVLDWLASGNSMIESAAQTICYAASEGSLPQPHEYVPFLILALQSSQHAVRQTSAAALAHIGIDDLARSAVPALTKLLDDPDPRVRDAAEAIIAREFPFQR